MSFLGRVQTGMIKFARPNREVVVRMALSGHGAVPDYRFETDEGEHLLTVTGSKHKPSDEGPGERAWSTATMSFYEVTDALMDLASAEIDRIRAQPRP
jgi:hypothetical protein